MASAQTISIVIPVFNEAENIVLLYKAITEVMEEIKAEYELLFIDDKSTDQSARIISELIQNDKRVKIIMFRRNYGQTAAIVAGIQHSKGDIIVTLDADLQNDPKDIPKLIRKLEEGYDLASGWRKNRKDNLLFRCIPSWIANRIISRVTGLRLHDYGCTLKAYTRDSLKEINLYGEMHRFIPAYIHWSGGKVTEVAVSHNQRKYGKSKYGAKRTFKVLLDLLTVRFLLGNYATSPLYFFGRWGFLMIFLGSACALITLIEKIVAGYWVHKNPLMLLSIFFIIIGTQFMLMGLLAELSMRIYYETTRKSIYIIQKKINC